MGTVTLTRRQRVLLGVVVNLAAFAAWAAEATSRRPRHFRRREGFQSG